MAKTKMFYMPVFIDQWMGSTTIQRMSMAAEGIYNRLLMVQWIDDHIGQTAEDAREVVRCTDDEWGQFEKFFDKCFPVDEDGFRRNPANARIKAAKRGFNQKQADNGRRGGRPKKEVDENPKQNPNETQTKPKQNPDVNPTHNPNKTQMVTQIITQKKPSNSIEFIDNNLEDIPSPSGEGVQGERDASFLELVSGEPWWAKSPDLLESRIAACIASTKLKSGKLAYVEPPGRDQCENLAAFIEGIGPPSPGHVSTVLDAWQDYHAKKSKAPYVRVVAALRGFFEKREADWARVRNQQSFGGRIANRKSSGLDTTREAIARLETMRGQA